MGLQGCSKQLLYYNDKRVVQRKRGTGFSQQVYTYPDKKKMKDKIG